MKELNITFLRRRVLRQERRSSQERTADLAWCLGAFVCLEQSLLLQRFRDLGVRFISLEEALADEVYKREPPNVLLRQGRSLLEQWQVFHNEPPYLFNRALVEGDSFRAS